MTDEDLIAKAERVEHRPNGEVYVTLPVNALSAEEFSELIMGEVKKLQSQRETVK